MGPVMGTRGHVTLLFAALLQTVLAVCPVAAAAQAATMAEIAILTPAFSPWHPLTEGFRDGLEELGHVGGRDVRFEVRAAQGDATRLPALARELTGRSPSLLYLWERQRSRSVRARHRTCRWSSWRSPTPCGWDSFRAWRTPAATPPASPTFDLSSPPSAWSCSRRSCRHCAATASVKKATLAPNEKSEVDLEFLTITGPKIKAVKRHELEVIEAPLQR